MREMKQLELPLLPEPAPWRRSQQDAGPTRGALKRLRLTAGELCYRFVRARRRTIAIHVEGGKVEVRAPRYATLAEVEAFIRHKERWIGQRMAERRPPPLDWRAGTRLALLGRMVTLAADPAATQVTLAEERLLLPQSAADRWPQLVIEWLRSNALALFRERLAHFAAALGVAKPSVGLSNSRSQWGSCHKKGPGEARVLLHWRLYQLPLRLIDYVVAHELAHLKELNHSSHFWAVVASMVPDHVDARRELNRLGGMLPEL